MAKTARRKLKCPKCDRTFSMPAHLARHMSSHTGGAGKKAAKKKGPTARSVKRPDRYAGVARRHGLSSMTLEQLSELITAARAEARRKIAELQYVIQ